MSARLRKKSVAPADGVAQQVARACVFAAWWEEQELNDAQLLTLKQESGLQDQPTDQDLDAVARTVLERNQELKPLAESWSDHIARFYRLYGDARGTVVRWMLIVAALIFVVALITTLTIGLQCASEQSTNGSHGTYPVAHVLVNLVVRFVFAILCVLFVVTRVLWPRRRVAYDGNPVSAGDRFAQWIITLSQTRLGGTQQLEEAEGDSISQGVRSRVFGLLNPTACVVTTVLLLASAGLVGLNAGLTAGTFVNQSVFFESTPAWKTTDPFARQQLLRGWLWLTATDPESFTGGSDMDTLMEWLCHSTDEGSWQGKSYEPHWRDSFFRLINRSNWFLIVLSLLPLAVNYGVFALACSRLALPSGDVPSRLSALSVGYETCGDVVEGIRRATAPAIDDDPSVEVKEPAPAPATRMNDEVWVVSLHTLGDSVDLLGDDAVATMKREFQRPVVLKEAVTARGRNALTGGHAAGDELEQPACIIYLVHAPASPTHDIRDCMARVAARFPRAAKFVVLADRHEVAESNRDDIDNLWRSKMPSNGDGKSPWQEHHIVTSLSAYEPRLESIRKLAREVSRGISPDSTRPDEEDDARVAQEADSGVLLQRAYSIVRTAFLQVVGLRGPDFDERLQEIGAEARDQLHRIRDDTGRPTLFDGAVTHASRLGRQAFEAGVVGVGKGCSAGRSHVGSVLRWLQAQVFRAASSLTALAVACLFLAIIPLFIFFMFLAAVTWAAYAGLRCASPYVAAAGPDRTQELPSPHERATRLIAFIADAMKSVCSSIVAEESGNEQCRRAVEAWRRSMPRDQVPAEADLEQCWNLCFPSQRLH